MIRKSRPHRRKEDVLPTSYTQTVLRRKNKLKSLVAIASTMLVVVWDILSRGVVYWEFLDQQEAA